VNYLFSQLTSIIKTISKKINHDIIIQKIYIDTREIFYSQNALFLALVGKRNGNLFSLDAYNKGIRHFILSEIPENFPNDADYILVENTLNALQEIAIFHRNQYNLPVFAITGSNGKTIVKEWLNVFFSQPFKIVKSPKSYNSQIGVPLSILEMNDTHELGIFEAGISQPNEMEKLEKIIQPTDGILTHMGDAHQEYFLNYEQKLLEKLKLFVNCKKIYASIHDEITLQILSNQYPNSITISKNLPTTYHYEYENSILSIKNKNFSYKFKVHFYDQASIENLALCLLTGIEKKLPIELLQNQISYLPILPMRLELITDNEEFTFIIDTWSSDFESLQQALFLLNQTQSFSKKILVLTDFENLTLNSDLFQYILKNFSSSQLYLIGKKFSNLKNFQVFQNTKEFLEKLRWEDFVNSVILLKGSRSFELEQVYHYLNLKASTTYLKINLQQMKKNFGIYKSLLNNSTKVMVMLKADSYGSGTWEIAKTLENQIDYIGVAYTVEGVQLRKKGVFTPIMIMTPDINSLHLLQKYQLEPAVGSLELLHAIVQSGDSSLKIHIEIETGMNRLGFDYKDLPKIIQILKNSDLKLISIFTHFASTDQKFDDDFTHQQFAIFKRSIDYFHNQQIFPIAHCLNTSGIERFPQYQLDMVRLGIGLYGISENIQEIEEIGKMYSRISRIHSIKKGESVGYNKSFVAQYDMLIATIPVGYADGLKRSLSNGNWSFLVHQELCPIVGKICMDMSMIDITHVPFAKVGDEVLIFGKNSLSIKQMAKKLNTIPYECLVNIPSRVKRIFVEE